MTLQSLKKPVTTAPSTFRPTANAASAKLRGWLAVVFMAAGAIVLPAAADDAAQPNAGKLRWKATHDIAVKAASAAEPLSDHAQLRESAHFSAEPMTAISHAAPPLHAVPACSALRSALPAVCLSTDESPAALAKVGMARRRATPPSRARFRSKILQVAQQEPVNDPFQDTVESKPVGDDTNPSEAMPDDRYSSEPGRLEPDPDRPSNAVRDAFPDEPAPAMAPPDAPTELPAPPNSGDANDANREQDNADKDNSNTAAECKEDKQRCTDAVGRLTQNRLSKIELDIAVQGNEGIDFPCECELAPETYGGRNWDCTCMTWKASGLCHKPLYFEDVHLERYGHSWNPVLQPFMSGAHFFLSVPLLPYKMGINPPSECMYTLGYYRPGSCAPYMIDPIPLSLRGLAFEAAVVGGAIAIIP